MSVSIDTYARMLLTEHVRSIGTTVGGTAPIQGVERNITLNAPVGLGLPTTAECSIVSGEDSFLSRKDSQVWLDTFVIKEPSSSITASPQGITRKGVQFVIWVKTDKNYGAYYNEAICNAVEEHFPNNKHLIDSEQNNVTVLNTHQQATIAIDSDTGRLYNRVFINCEIYYKNN
tara:strand:- start:1713 stop:2234 length:522 start_codon:yes stop_codon:yes gene_type:complete